MTELERIAMHLAEGHAAAVGALVAEVLDAGVDARRILEDGLIPGMAVVGRRFRDNEIFVPEVLVAARAMKAGLAHLEPIFAAAGIPPVGTVVLGTVKGDIHDIGKNLVAMMLRGAGFRVVDAGVDVASQAFVEAAAAHGAQLVGLSALLTTTMSRMPETIAALRQALPEVRVMVGGAPVSREYASSIGAHGWAANAADAVDEALRLTGASSVRA